MFQYYIYIYAYMQIFALIVLLYTQSDFIDGIFLFTERWKAFSGITTPIKFNVSAMLRVLVGNIGIFTSFILVVYSTEVVEMLLNFAAMEFVATLDDAAFAIAMKGFLGITLEKKALEIQEFRYIRRSHRGSFKRVFAYIFYILVVLGAFITVVVLQSRRQVGVDNEVYIQFDDSDIRELFGVSGVYRGCLGFRSKDTGDIGYVDISVDCPKPKDDGGIFPSGNFVYCRRDLDSWVYLAEPTDDPCKEGNFLMRSFVDEEDNIASNAFDILTHAKGSWVIKPPSSGGEIIVDYSFVGSVQKFKSSFLGCPGGLEAIHVENVYPQRTFDALPESESFYPVFGEDGKTCFEGKDSCTYRDVFSLSYRPIFQRNFVSQAGRYEVILFDGLRWFYLWLNPNEFALSIDKTTECKEEDPDCWIVFSKYYLSSTSWMFNGKIARIQAISDPMMFLTPSDTGVPTGALEWYVPVVSILAGFIVPGKPMGPARFLQENNDDYDYNSNDYTYEYYTEVESTEYGFQCAEVARTDCGEDESAMSISFTTDGFPHETQIFIFFGQNLQDIGSLSREVPIMADQELVAEFSIEKNDLIGLTSTSSENRHFLTTCIPRDECLQVVFLDSFGDGLFSPGEYDISVGNESVTVIDAEPFDCRSYQFGPMCLNLSVPGRAANCTVESILNSTQFFDKEVNFFDEEPTFTETLECAQDEIPFLVYMQTDDYPLESKFLVFFGQSIEDLRFLPYAPVDGRNSDFTVSRNAVTELRFPQPDSSYLLQSCIPIDEEAGCIQIAILDTAGDGLFDLGQYALQYGDQAVSGGNDEEWDCRLFQFGPQCSDPSRSSPTECSYLDDVWNFRPTPTPAPVETAPPVDTPVCADDETLLLVDLRTDEYPLETRILIFHGGSVDDMPSVQQFLDPSIDSIFDLSADIVTKLTFQASDSLSQFLLQSCVPNVEGAGCIQIAAVDSVGDGLNSPGGYTFHYGEEIVDGSGIGWGCRLYQVGWNCPDPNRANPSECLYEGEILKPGPT